MRLFLIIILCLTVNGLSGQVTQAEQLREKGYQARVAGNYELSLQYYEAILSETPDDYDANLAIARLHALLGNYDASITTYQRMLTRDPRDWEALHGIGNCYLEQGFLDKAVEFHRRAVAMLPDYVPGYLALAKALAWKGKLDEAIAVYQSANRKDPTYAEVWAGLGKMYYWKGQPLTARSYYQKALDLDPGNTSVQSAFQQIQQDLRAWISGQLRFFQEKEQSYRIDALIQQYSFSKRLDDHWQLQINSLFDYSNREFTLVGNDTTRWFLNTWARATYITEHHRWGLYLGYSITDKRWSTYGLNWQTQYKWGDLGLQNTISAGYEYFFYWNTAGRHLINESLRVSWKRWEAEMGVSLGRVDEKPVRRYNDLEFQTGSNPFLIYQFGLNFQVLNDPVARIAARYSTMDFDYQSPDYYSPYDRRLAGLGATLQKKFQHWYIYSAFSYNLGTETFYFRSDQPGVDYESGRVDVDNWSASLEIGYTQSSFSLSAGGSRFENPFYENWIGFIALSQSL